jgi:hypothetical protein
MFTYRPPAGVVDLKDEQKAKDFLEDWHKAVAKWFDGNIKDLPPGQRYFFSETTHTATGDDTPVQWDAFPLALKRAFDKDNQARWAEADRLGYVERGIEVSTKMPHRRQDEYCEWHAYRNGPGGAIDRIVFTSEAPEYWIELAKHDFATVLALYRTWVSPDVQEDDLRLARPIRFGNGILDAGSYNPYNVWNTEKGCMHLTHPANTLGAEINLAAQATISRKDNKGNRVTDVRRFACASDFRDVNRSSDPNIGSGVNLTIWPSTAGSKVKSITLADPVGLYIDDIDKGAITDEHGDVQPGWFKIERGVSGHGLMAVFKAPASSRIGMDKIRLEGLPVEYGGQLADKIRMVLYAKTADLGLPGPTLEPASAHCCKPNKIVPVHLQNLSHLGTDESCKDSQSDEAYDELEPNPAWDAGIVPAKPRASRTGNSRMAQPQVDVDE